MKVSVCTSVFVPLLAVLFLPTGFVAAQLTDVTQTPNALNAGIAKSYTQQIGVGQGNPQTPDSSMYIIARDPFRSIVRGRQLFQRKFTHAQGLGPRTNDGIGMIEKDGSLGAGLADSCAACHGRPHGSAGAGGTVFTRPDSRDAPHLFGLGLVEMLADEITQALRTTRSWAIFRAKQRNRPVSAALVAKGVNYGTIKAFPNGQVDTSGVHGVDPDLRVRPFFAEGSTISMREFIVGALNAEMGMEAVDPLLLKASQGNDVTTPAGMKLTGSEDKIEAPVAKTVFDDPDADGVVNEVPTSIVDHLEFYLLNYFKPGTGESTSLTAHGRRTMERIGCTKCHVPDLVIDRDRRVADTETAYDPGKNGFNGLFTSATPLFSEIRDTPSLPTLKVPLKKAFVVKNIFADFKRHDLGPNFHELNFDGSVTKMFMTEPLWGVGSTAPYGHDGRSIDLKEVILRHGGEAQESRDAFARLSWMEKLAVTEFLRTLVIFPPPDTASSLDPAVPSTPGFPQMGHGSIRLNVLFNNPSIGE